MTKIIYLTSNPHKVEEANRHFVKRYGFEVEIKNPDFEVVEIQAKSSIDVVKYSARYAVEKLGHPVLVSDTALYIDFLGGLPGPYNAYFDKQIGVEKFLKMMEKIDNRKARLEHSFGFCEPNKKPVVFSGGSTGTIAKESRGSRGRWHNLFYIPDGETQTLSQLREKDELYEAKFWGTAIDDFARWYKENFLK
jgi:XTP/dITP diphosphohydrolase|tara:strand:- start:160 stop:738 length:579 start_codon:yes stop_codon:yes gene_type:complete